MRLSIIGQGNTATLAAVAARSNDRTLKEDVDAVG